MPNLIDKLPAAVGDRLRTHLGRQFSRFAVVAAVSLGASELALFIFTELMHLTGGISGVSAAAIGALTSYLMSRWAWRRKGKPNVLRETIPFWVVSAGAWIVLGLATKVGLRIAASAGATGFRHFLIVGGVYFLANCVTFVLRFLIFHYVLFADRSGNAGAAGSGPGGGIETESLSPIGAVAAEDDEERS
jgi:putative flippase GtrA